MNKKLLVEKAFECRKSIIKMATDGGCFIGASLSCADILAYLYVDFLNINKDNLKDPKRDILILSKGHDEPALYSIFAEQGIIDKKRLKNHLKVNDDIYWHPNRNIPGVEFHSGSLGHGLSVGIGMAFNSRIDKIDNKIVVVVGDGELNEGSNWESFLIANAYKLKNLIVVVDRNEFQANMKTEDLIPLEPLTKKLNNFGWDSFECDGHDFDEMDQVFSEIKNSSSERPKFVVMNTVRGKGLPSIEKDALRWFVNFSKEEVSQLLIELETGEKTKLTSTKIIAR